MLPEVIACNGFTLRPWRREDKPALIKHADNRNVWRNLRDVFPHPYTERDADAWLDFATVQPWHEGKWAIDVAGEAVGTISLEPQTDVDRLSREIGYWLGEPFWGRGIVTEAVGRVTDLALAESDIIRVFAGVFSWNPRSMRVLERNGYLREAVMPRAGFKDGTVIDRVLYARTRESEHSYVHFDATTA